MTNEVNRIPPSPLLTKDLMPFFPPLSLYDKIGQIADWTRSISKLPGSNSKQNPTDFAFDLSSDESFDTLDANEDSSFCLADTAAKSHHHGQHHPKFKASKDFTAYGDVCFKEFGDRVLCWTTVNEANVFFLGGYDTGSTPPRRYSPPFGIGPCFRGNSSTEPYIAARNMFLTHSFVVRLYKRKYKLTQHGFVGLNITS
ncbi:hypothetical protein P3S68_028304 [Capsicum galapagoense]